MRILIATLAELLLFTGCVHDRAIINLETLTDKIALPSDPIERAKVVVKKHSNETTEQGFNEDEKLLFRGYLAYLQRHHEETLANLGKYLDQADLSKRRRDDLIALKAIVETHHAQMLNERHLILYRGALRKYSSLYANLIDLQPDEAEPLADIRMQLGEDNVLRGKFKQAKVLYETVLILTNSSTTDLGKQMRFDTRVRIAREVYAGEKHFGEAVATLKTIEQDGLSPARLAGLRFYEAFYEFLGGNYRQSIQLFSDNQSQFEATGDSKLRNAYWKARALLKIKKVIERKKTLSDLAFNFPFSYYGQLARKRLSYAGPFAKGGETISQEQTQAVEVANALTTGNRFLDAFRALIPLFPPDEQKFGSPALEIYYPRPFLKDFENSSSKYAIEIEALLALSKQESAFDEKVVAFDFGYGVMQVQGENGTFIARQKRMGDFTPEMLLQCSVNIDFGSTELRQDLDDLNHTLTFAVAAYNAGIFRVKSWIRYRSRGDIEEFIEDIPFEGTSRHVRNILKNRASYFLIYKNQFPQSFF